MIEFFDFHVLAKIQFSEGPKTTPEPPREKPTKISLEVL